MDREKLENFVTELKNYEKRAQLEVWTLSLWQWPLGEFDLKKVSTQLGLIRLFLTFVPLAYLVMGPRTSTGLQQTVFLTN